MNDTIFLANNTVVGDGTQQAAPAAVAAETQVPAQEQPSFMSGFMNPNTQLILTMAIVFAVMYFFTIRPQRKREKQLREMQDSLKTGDWIVTFSGMYGKVVDVGTDMLMVEFGTNKGVRIPVRKSETTKTSEPVIVSKKEEEADSQ